MILPVLELAVAGLLLAQMPGETVGASDEPFVVQQEFTSPVTGETFFTYVLREALVPTSYDYDRCPHPPINTLAYTLVIDPATGYVASPESFQGECPWDTEDLKLILGEPKFDRTTPEGLPWAGAYPWEKFENAARLAQAAEYPSVAIANWWLLAAWSIRLDVISGHNEFDGEVERLFANLPRRDPSLKDLLTPYELQLADYWAEQCQLGQLVDVGDTELSLALAWLYRSRGELVAAENWLGRAALNDPAIGSGDLLYHYLDSSIDLEREYLRTTDRWLLKAWNGAELSTARESGTAYLLGEIRRRLGDFAGAVYWYDQALATHRGALSTELIQHQRALADGGRGY